jgi:hypothetical protein
VPIFRCVTIVSGTICTLCNSILLSSYTCYGHMSSMKWFSRLLYVPLSVEVCASSSSVILRWVYKLWLHHMSVFLQKECWWAWACWLYEHLSSFFVTYILLSSLTWACSRKHMMFVTMTLQSVKEVNLFLTFYDHLLLLLGIEYYSYMYWNILRYTILASVVLLNVENVQQTFDLNYGNSIIAYIKWQGPISYNATSSNN